MDNYLLALLTREVFGNVSHLSRALFYGFSLLAIGVLVWGIASRVRLWRGGRPDPVPTAWRRGLNNLWQLALLQRRVRGRGKASTAHMMLFGGFVVLTIGTTLIAIEHFLAALLGRDAGDPVFHKGLYYVVYEVVMDTAGIALVIGCVYFAYRRWKRPPALGHEWRDWLVLGLLAAIGVTGYVLEGLRILHEQPAMPGFSFVGAGFAKGFELIGMTSGHAGDWHIAIWWFHAALALALIAGFPYSRLLHGIAGTVRLAAGVDRLGAVSPVSVEEVEETGEIGVARIDQFKRRQLVELDACVSCGRCDEACPAFEAGKPLSPRDVVQDIRQCFGKTSAPELAGGVVTAETLWSCTTCSACVDVCPLGVNPLGFITDLRRFLVGEGHLHGPPAQALEKTHRTGNPWGMPAPDRMAWADGMNVPEIEAHGDCEVLYWVGCVASYDRRLQKVARSLVTLFERAGVNFAVLGKSESCTGEAARRMGDELLFQELAAKNVETFSRFGVRKGSKRIVSTCPHCVNSFRQDYAQLGADLEAVHHTEFLDELIRAGRLKIPQESVAANEARAPGSVTYHDPCYLARVHGVTQAPRAVLGLGDSDGNLIEMPRHGRQTACCGAGGGRMWFDDSADKRIGRHRVEEAIATGAQTLAVSCPFCLTMMKDGLANRGVEMNVRDVAEILADSLPD